MRRRARRFLAVGQHRQGVIGIHPDSGVHRPASHVKVRLEEVLLMLGRHQKFGDVVVDKPGIEVAVLECRVF